MTLIPRPSSTGRREKRYRLINMEPIQNKTKPKFSRRDFLRVTFNSLLTLGGALIAGGLARFFSYQPDPPPPTDYDLGPASQFPSGESTVLPQIPAVLTREGDTFSALSLKCTHLGCTVQQTGGAFECPCHGSRYDENGNVLRGPAARALQKLRAEVTKDGNLHIYVG